MPTLPIIKLNSDTLASLSSVFCPLNDTFSDAGLRCVNGAKRYELAWKQGLGHNFENILASLIGKLRRHPHFLIIRDLNPAHGHALLAGVAQLLGQLVMPEDVPGYEAIRALRPKQNGSPDSGFPLDELLHTDGTDVVEPNDLTCLFCVRADEGGGGESVIMAEADVLAALHEYDIELLGWLRDTPLPWKLKEDDKSDIAHETVISEDGLRWMSFTIRAALGRNCDAEFAERLDRIQTCFETAKHRHFLFSMAPGDLLILNNRRALHARTPVRDAGTSHRLLLRAKVVSAQVRSKGKGRT